MSKQPFLGDTSRGSRGGGHSVRGQSGVLCPVGRAGQQQNMSCPPRSECSGVWAVLGCVLPAQVLVSSVGLLFTACAMSQGRLGPIHLRAGGAGAKAPGSSSVGCDRLAGPKSRARCHLHLSSTASFLGRLSVLQASVRAHCVLGFPFNDLWATESSFTFTSMSSCFFFFSYL